MSQPWSITGEYMEACSCAYLCPCITSNATAPATEDFCTFTMTYRIDAGTFAAVDLAGVCFTVVAKSKAIMSQGEWVLGVIVDSSASEAQANAIVEIASGSAGGPMAAFAPLVAEIRGVERHPIRFEIDGAQRRLTIPGVIEQSIEGVPSAVVPGECWRSTTPSTRRTSGSAWRPPSRIWSRALACAGTTRAASGTATSRPSAGAARPECRTTAASSRSGSASRR